MSSPPLRRHSLWMAPKVNRIITFIHEIKLGNDSNSSQALRIDTPSQFQGIRIGQILICRWNCQDQSIFLFDVVIDHVSNLKKNSLNVNNQFWIQNLPKFVCFCQSKTPLDWKLTLLIVFIFFDFNWKLLSHKKNKQKRVDLEFKIWLLTKCKKRTQKINE